MKCAGTHPQKFGSSVVSRVIAHHEFFHGDSNITPQDALKAIVSSPDPTLSQGKGPGDCFLGCAKSPVPTLNKPIN